MPEPDIVPGSWAAVIPLANEEAELPPLVGALQAQMDALDGGRVYFVVDRVSRDRTLDCCRVLARDDPRFVTCWEPGNRHVVDAYLAGFRAALAAGHRLVVEMDAGMSHDPRAIPAFLRALDEGNDCAFGSRYIAGGSMAGSPLRRRFLSRGGTLAARWLLGVCMADLTSGFQGFRREVLERLVAFPLRSTAHFYQTEVRYLLRRRRWTEVPIHYRAPSPRVSRGAIRNALAVLAYYSLRRLAGSPPAL